MTSRFLTPGDVAGMLGVSSETVCAWVRTCRLPAYRLPSGQIRIEPAEVTRALERGFDLPFALDDPPGTSPAPQLWIYGVQANGDHGDIKVGISADPRTRLSCLQVGSAVTLVGISAWPGTLDEERELHAAFARRRIRGEWFAYDRELHRYLVEEGGDFRWERAAP